MRFPSLCKMDVRSLVALLLLCWTMTAVSAQYQHQQPQINIQGVLVDKNSILDTIGQFYKSTCEKNNVQLNRQELVKHIENCIQPHIDQLNSISKNDPGMMIEIMFALKQNPISLNQEQKAWIKKQAVAPGCKILPCANPLKNPLLKGCLAGADPISKGVAFTDLYHEALCKKDGEGFLAILEIGSSACAETYGDRVLSCVRTEANVLLAKDAYLNQTVEETCGSLGKLHNCLVTSSVACGPKTPELLRKTFQDVEVWVNGVCRETEKLTNDSSHQSIFSFSSIIIVAILSWNIF